VIGVLVGREVETFEQVPKVRQRQCIVIDNIICYAPLNL